MEDLLIQLKKQIDQASNIAIFGHIHTDGDCIGSCLGLGSILEKLGKNVKYFLDEKPSNIFDFLPNIDKFETNFDWGNYDIILFLDLSEIRRIGAFYEQNPNYFDNANKIVIDHHISGIKFGNLNIINGKLSSNCELIYLILKDLYPDLIDSQIATYLYLGILTDSGNFVFDNANDQTLANAANLIRLGADKNYINSHLFQNKSFDAIKFINKILDRMIYIDGIIYSYYDCDELLKENLDKEQINFGLEIMQTIKTGKIFILFKKDGNFIKGSIRSIEPISHIIAKKYGGGGHAKASGFKKPIETSFMEEINNIINYIRENNKSLE